MLIINYYLVVFDTNFTDGTENIKLTKTNFLSENEHLWKKSAVRKNLLVFYLHMI